MARVYSFVSSSSDKRRRLSPIVKQEEPPVPVQPKPEQVDVTASNNSNTQQQQQQNTHHDLSMMNAVVTAAMNDVKGKKPADMSLSSTPTTATTANAHELMEPALQLLGLATAQQQEQLVHIPHPPQPFPLDHSEKESHYSNGSPSISTTCAAASSSSSTSSTTAAEGPTLIKSEGGGESSQLEHGDEYYKRGSWTAEEDELLVQGIRQFGYGRWKEIATIIPGRRGKQLKQRWDNSLASKYVDTEWLQSKIQEQQQEQEEPAEKLFRLFETSDWAEIAQRITERAREGNGAEVIEALLSHALMNQTYLFQQQQQQTPQQQQDTQPAQTSQQSQQPLQPQQRPQEDQKSSQQICSQRLSQPRPSSAPRKRRRSDPALAETQSAAMSIYASATPITTTIDNQVQTVYPCLFPNCGKSFARLYNLKSHSRTHTDDRPYVCQFCQAAFSRNHDLKRHSKIHGQEKPYKCLGCNKDFSRLDALKRHKNNKRNKPACNAPDLQNSSTTQPLQQTSPLTTLQHTFSQPPSSSSSTVTTTVPSSSSHQ